MLTISHHGLELLEPSDSNILYIKANRRNSPKEPRPARILCGIGPASPLHLANLNKLLLSFFEISGITPPKTQKQHPLFSSEESASSLTFFVVKRILEGFLGSREGSMVKVQGLGFRV